MYKILHAVIYLIFCIFSLNLFIVRIVFLLHAVIFFACCFTLVCRNKSPTGLMLHVCEYSTKNKISMSMSTAQKISKHQDIKQKEPPQKYRLGTISNKKLLAGLNRFYMAITSPSASAVVHNI